MKTIPLTRNQVALVDDADYEWLSKFKWHFDGEYAARAKSKEHGKKLRMHIALMPPQPGKWTDHINQNKLDNRRENLRYVDPPQSTLNSWRTDNTSGFRGVQRISEKVWAASTTRSGKHLQIGCYDSPEEAAAAYTAFVERALKGDVARRLMGKPYRTNTSGARNVYLMWNGRWQVTVKRNKQTFYLGCYPTREAAVESLRTFHEEVR